ncbi:MAG: hypothetical protein E7319_08910 [Clostridiales bacterium]|nr:hypothetical protein [Clostridiales bacterium]
MGVWAMVVSIILAATLIGFLISEHRQARKHQRRVRKMYASAVLDALKPMLIYAQKHVVESASVDKTGVVFRYLSPNGGESVFRMKDYGFPNMSDKQQDAMRTILEEQLPDLADQKRYRLTRHNIRLLDGSLEYAYTYSMSRAYKQVHARSSYYAVKPSPYSW